MTTTVNSKSIPMATNILVQLRTECNTKFNMIQQVMLSTAIWVRLNMVLDRQHDITSPVDVQVLTFCGMSLTSVLTHCLVIVSDPYFDPVDAVHLNPLVFDG